MNHTRRYFWQSAGCLAAIFTMTVGQGSALAKHRRPEQHQRLGQHYQQGFAAKSQRKLGSGCRSTVTLVTHTHDKFRHLPVLKVIHKVHPHEVRAAGSAERARELYAHRVVGVASLLRENNKFRRKFGDIVPETISPAPGMILQALGEGVRYKELSRSKRGDAKSAVAAAAKKAERLHGIRATTAKKNFLFNPTDGRISSWYDMISDAARHSQPRLRER
jgi:hypothetical protein